MTTTKRRTAYDPLRLSVPLHEHREDETADLPSVRNQRILPRQAGDRGGDARREVGTEAETVSTSTERLDQIIGAIEKHLKGDVPSHELFRDIRISVEETLDMARDAKRWREHVRPPTRCDHRLDR